LELDIICITWYDLKLSLGLLFRISNIFSLSCGTSRTYSSKRKNVIYQGSTHKKKIEKKIKSQKHQKIWSLKKNNLFMYVEKEKEK